MLICPARPFPNLRPLAETGPIFLCADHRIIYGMGQITKASAVAQCAKDLFDRPEVAFVDIRSASNNCFLTRVTRSE